MRGVLYGAPGTPFLDEIGLGLQRATLLDRWVTTFQHDRAGQAERALLRLPRPLGRRLRRELGRRSTVGVDPALVDNNLALDLPRLLAVRCGASVGSRERLADWRNQRLGRRIARQLDASQTAVVCSDGCAERPFRAARRQGIPTMLLQTIAHVDEGRERMRAEAKRSPELAASLPYLSLPDEYFAARRREYELADLIVAPSEFVRRSLLEHGVKAKIEVIPFGSDTSRFVPGAPNRAPGPVRYLFVGQISQRKGIKYLLEAAALLDLDPHQLTLVGPRHISDTLLSRYEGHFTHLATVPHSEVDACFRAADVFVYPSLLEGSAVAVYEAMGSGLPVVLTEATGSVARDGVESVLVPAGDSEALATAMNRLGSDTELRRAMGEAARARALAFDWQTHHEKLAEAVTELRLSTRPGRA